MLDLKHFATVLTETKAALKPIGNAHKSGGISDEDFTEATRHIIRIFQMAAESDLSGAYFLLDKAPESEEFTAFVYDDPYTLEYNLSSLIRQNPSSNDERYVRSGFYKIQEMSNNNWRNPLFYEITEKGTLIFHSKV